MRPVAAQIIGPPGFGLPRGGRVIRNTARATGGGRGSRSPFHRVGLRSVPRGEDPADVPDPQDPATFERSRLDWAEIHSPRHTSLLAWYRRLIALRRQVPALTDPRLGRTETDCDSDAGWLVVRRGPVTVAVNLGAAAWTFPAGPSAALLAASDPRVELAGQGLVLPPDTVAILKRYTAAS